MRDLPLFKHLNAGTLVTVTCGLGLLYVGRDVLEPIALASILSLVIAPLIRSMRRAGLPQMPATLLSVLLATTCLVGVGIVLAFQLVAVTGDLPKYRAAMRTKVATVRDIAERPFARIEAELSAVAPPGSTPPATGKRGM
ncbi:MAG TPA: AI-2E family transporter, partial [Ramlibacter sp.]